MTDTILMDRLRQIQSSEGNISNRVRNILKQKIMGAGFIDDLADIVTESVNDMQGGYGTRQGALNGWKTRRANMRKAKKTTKKPTKKTTKKTTAKGAKKTTTKRKVPKNSGSKTANKKKNNNPWLKFLAQYRKVNKGLPQADIMREAANEYRRRF